MQQISEIALSLSHSAAAAEGAQGKQKKQEAVMHAALIYAPAGKRAAVSVVAGMRLPEADVMPLTSIVHSRVFQARIHPTRRSRDPSDNKIKDV
jgi:hypothetical protein